MHVNFSFILAAVIIIGAGCSPTATQRTISDESLETTEMPEQEIEAVGVDDQPAVVEDQGEGQVVEPFTQRVYVVRKGDTLWSIADAYYGDGQRWRDILEANPGLEPTKMRVGQQLILP